MQESADSTLSITHQAREKFSPQQAKLIADTVAKGCSPAELHMFLEIAARLELNPFVGEIWAARMPGRNGSGGQVAMIVGRDGFIKIANRSDDYRGMDGDVVRENDTFAVKRADGKRVVTHEYEGGTDKRGPIVGAWAEVLREGRPGQYFFAPMHEYKPTSERKLQFSPWGSQESVMILKCAQSTALRLAFNVSGVYSEGEMAQAMARGEAPAEDSEPDVEWGEDEALGIRLRELVDEARRIKPEQFRAAKVGLRLRGADRAGREAFAVELEQFIVAHGGSVPGEIVDGTAAAA